VADGHNGPVTVRLLFSQHARNRMLQWDIDIADVISVLADHETIEEYDDGTKLLLGRSAARAFAPSTS
jgi:hypothetical protein